jgi:urease beta subunit
MGMGVPKGQEKRRKQVGSCGRKAAKIHNTSPQAVEIGQIHKSFFKLVEDLCGPRKEEIPACREASSTAISLEQGSSNLVFELRDLTGKRRLADMAGVGG